MAIEKNPNDITAPIDVAKDKLNTQSESLGIDVNINEEEQENMSADNRVESAKMNAVSTQVTDFSFDFRNLDLKAK